MSLSLLSYHTPLSFLLCRFVGREQRIIETKTNLKMCMKITFSFEAFQELELATQVFKETDVHIFVTNYVEHYLPT